jgi:hypothetical protein
LVFPLFLLSEGVGENDCYYILEMLINFFGEDFSDHKTWEMLETKMVHCCQPTIPHDSTNLKDKFYGFKEKWSI